METVKTLAQKMNKMMQVKNRIRGNEFYCLKTKSPLWMTDIVRAAHGNSLPNDYIYQFIVDALCVLQDNEDTETARSSIESNIYNHELLEWVNSSLDRAQYVNDAVQNYGIDSKDFDLFIVLGMGQLQEKLEVFDAVLEGLEKRINGVKAA